MRRARPSDFPFIFDTFAKSYRSFGLGAFASLKNTHSAKFLLRAHLTYLRDEKRAFFDVASDPNDPDLLLGWICHNSPVLHYAYVKQIYRRQGIFTSMLAPLAASNVIFVSFWTNYARDISVKKPMFRSIF